jgi:hypothetical protein
MADKVEARARADATLVKWIASASKMGRSIQLKSGRYPLAQMTERTPRALKSKSVR